MSIISLFGGIFCRETSLTNKIVESTGYKLIRDTDIVHEASVISGIPVNKIERSFSAKASMFNKFTHEKERSIANLKLVLANSILNDKIAIEGFSGLLIPPEINHVLKVCLIADMKSRVALAMEKDSISENEATRIIRKTDEDRAAWVQKLFNKNDPWDSSLYDIIIPTDKMNDDEIIALITKVMKKDALSFNESTGKAIEDFGLSSKIEAALTREGHNVEVSACQGKITLTINKNVLMLSKLEEELKKIASGIPGVKSVETKVGPGFHQADIYRKYDFEIPSKVLLVDDEREFVQTLSERLLMRDMGSAVAYDGESALELIKEDEPEVMILDLRMPGIDGIEVLRKVKETQPEIEVIILTGHGSESDREVCMNLGAFAYLHKPVDIDLLSETIRQANEKIRSRKAANR
ncbi:MAG: response regulator [Deltaproteobacteria bacterium]|nr:response regulator [Deltaproteobacteria bacterium]